jgi:hypothetical protein
MAITPAIETMIGIRSLYVQPAISGFTLAGGKMAGRICMAK